MGRKRTPVAVSAAATNRKRKQQEADDAAAAEETAIVAKRYQKNQFQHDLDAQDRRHAVEALEKVLTRAAVSTDTAYEYEADPHACALRIETILFKGHKSVLCEAYDDHLRSILFNLQKEKNGALRKALLRNAISPIEFVAMGIQDLANPELVAARDNDADWAKAVAMAKSLENSTPTTTYTCRKCNNNKCRMAAYQLRGADEGMTTFVTCETCGHRWSSN